MSDYDIAAAFQAIENELISSMIRNMDRHRAEEDAEGILWSQWQTEQLKSLEKYKRENQKKYSKQFLDINGKIEALIRQARVTGNMEQEIAILGAIKSGFKGARRASAGATAEFFRLNDRKLEALIKATTSDMRKAETAVLRMANDQYRKTIFNAQVYANTGAGTYEKAVDMATKDMLSRGLNCVEYSNGARHTLSDYADMAIRTASKRAYLQGEGEIRQEWGISTVIINKRGNPCPKCLPFVGKVLVDDVWSNGKSSDGPYPLMSTAVAAGLYHPRCKDSHTTYFQGVSTADSTWTKEELEAIGETNKKEVEQQYAKRQEKRFGRLARYSLDGDNKKLYSVRKKQWESVVNTDDSDIIKKNGLMKDLPTLSDIKTNEDIQVLAEQFISNLGIDRTNITVSMKRTTDWGHCTFARTTTQSTIHYSDYVLNSNDKRPMTHRVKTAFHESFHLSAEGREWDGLTSSGSIKEPWRSLEETFTESSAHYLLERYGVTEKIAPSYAKELATNLPRLKKLEKYSGCSTIQDFGKIAFTDRQNGAGSLWLDLSKRMEEVTLPNDYYVQYHTYINDNKDDLFDMFLANMPGFEGYRSQMMCELNSAMAKDGIFLNDNEQIVYYGIIACTMQKVGVK